MSEHGASDDNKLGVGRLGYRQYTTDRLEGTNAVAHRADDTTDVLAEDCRQRQGKILLPCARPDLPINGVNARGSRLNQHKVVAQRGGGNIVLIFKFSRPAIFV